MACLASSPGRMRRTDVWISRDEMVDFLEYEASSTIKAIEETLWHDKKLTRSLSSNTLKNIVDKAIQNGHRLVGDTRIGVNLLKDCQIPCQIAFNKRGEINEPL